MITDIHAALDALHTAHRNKTPAREERAADQRVIEAMREREGALSGRIRRPMGRKRPKFLPARSLRHSMPKSRSFRTVCSTSAQSGLAWNAIKRLEFLEDKAYQID